MQFFFANKKVVQVSAHFLGGGEEGRHVQVVPVGERRENLGNHGHLDVAGHLQFALHALLLGANLIIFLLAPEDGTDDEDNHKDTQNLEQDHNQGYPVDTHIDIALRNNDGHDPTGALDRGIENQAGESPLVDGYTAGFSGLGGIHYHLNSPVCLFTIHRRHHNLASPADDDAVCLRIHLDASHQLREPVQGNIGRQNGRNSAFRVPDGQRVGGHEDFSSAFIDIRFRPIALPQLQRLGKPLLGRIIVFLRSQGLEFQAVRSFADIRRKQRIPFEIPRHHGHGRAYHHGVFCHYSLGNPDKAVRLVEAPLGNPDAVANGGFRLVHNVHNLVAGALQLALGPGGSFLLDSPLGEIILDKGGGFQGNGGHYDQQHTCPDAMPMFEAFGNLYFHSFGENTWSINNSNSLKAKVSDNSRRESARPL